MVAIISVAPKILSTSSPSKKPKRSMNAIKIYKTNKLIFQISEGLDRSSLIAFAIK